MAKTIISLLSEQLLPNYLVIKEKYKEGDELIFITTKKTKDSKLKIMIDSLKKFGIITEDALNTKVHEVYLDNENSWNKMRKEFKKMYKEGTTYLVNLTGGTKNMCLCLYAFFNGKNKKEKRKIIYVPLPENEMLVIDDEGKVAEDERKEDIKKRVNIDEYLKLCGIDDLNVEDKYKDLLKNFKEPNKRDLEGFDLLRGGVPWSAIKDDAKVQGFLKQYFPNEDLHSSMSDERRRNICGDWFEVFIRLKLTEALKEEKGFSLTAGIIPDSEKRTKNQIDCFFTLNNKCFMVECKTGCPGDVLTETIYKDVAINKSVIKAHSTKNYIFLLMKDPQTQFPYQAKRAENLEIGLYGGEYFLNENKFKELIGQIKKDAGLKEEGENAN